MARIIVSGFWDGHTPGDSVEVDDAEARSLVLRGRARYEEPKKGTTKKAEEAK